MSMQMKKTLAVVSIVLCVLVVASVIVMHRAKARAEASNCASNLASICLGARLYAEDNSGVFAPDVFCMSNELNTPKILFCSTDSNRSRMHQWSDLSQTRFTYEYLAAGMKEQQAMTSVIFRCPVHLHVVYGSGRLIRGDGTEQMWKGF